VTTIAGPGQRHALALAAGEARGTGAGAGRDAESLEQLTGAGATLAAPAASDPVGDVVERAHAREQRIALEDETDAAALRRQLDSGGGVEPALAVERHPAPLGPQQPGQRSQQRALAGARGAHHREPAGALELGP
jgi:hypothetical protein